VEAFDRDALLAQVRQFLGPGVTTEKTESVELLISNKAKRGAAAFIAGHLLLGDEADVRRCLAAASRSQTLRASETFKLLPSQGAEGPPLARTLSDDEAAVSAVVSLLTSRKEKDRATKASAPAALAPRSRYSVSETRLTDEGLERKTRGAFGLFGELLGRAAPRP
jgi:hypothetical protein